MSYTLYENDTVMIAIIRPKTRLVVDFLRMEYLVQTTFRGLARTQALERTIKEQAATLIRYCPSLISCHALVDARHSRKHHGNGYNIRLELKVPGDFLVFNGNTAEANHEEDLYVAIHHAFKSSKRLLKEYSEKRRGKVVRQTVE